MNWKNRLLGILLILFPLALSLLGRQLLQDDPTRLRREMLEEKLEAALGEIDSRKNFIEHFSRKFRAVEQRVFRAANPPEEWKKRRADLLASYPGAIEGILLDAQGRVVPDCLDRPVSRQLIQRFFIGYQAFVERGESLSAIECGFVKNFLGENVSTEREIHRELQYATSDPKRSYLYLSYPGPKGMLLIFFKTPIQPRRLALKEVVAVAERQNRGLRFSLVMDDESLLGVRSHLKIEENEVPDEFFPRLMQSASGSLWAGDTLLVKRALFPSVWVIGSARLAPVISGGLWNARSMAGLVVFLCGIWLGVGVLEPLISSSVKGKLLGAFLYSSLLPMIIMGFSARSFLIERRQVLERETHQQVESGLMRFDRSYTHFINKLNVNLSDRYFSPDDAAVIDYQLFRKSIQHLEKGFLFDTCVVYDASGAVAFHYQAPAGKPLLGNLMKYLGRMAKSGLERANGRGGRQASANDDLKILEVLSASPHLREMDWGALKFFFGVFPLGTPQDQVTHLVMLFWNSIRMEHRFLGERFSALNRQLDDGELFIWSNDDSSLSLPRQYQGLAFLRPFLNKVNNRLVSFRRRVRYQGQDYLLTGLRFRLLKHFSAIRLTPDRHIASQIRDLTLRFWFLVILLSFLCALIGVLLANMVLAPVRDLKRGLDAIAAQDFRYQIPVHQQDELGVAARLLNETTGELQDLELARTIQEAFFPGAALRVGDWKIWGRSRFASKVGGDYVDFMTMGDGKALMIMGDVSGHGAGAALVVAMARAAFAHPMVQGNPERMMTSLNTLMVSVLKRRKMMSCCLGLFDSSTRTFRLINAGHQWPLLCGDSSAEFVQTQGLPLGSAKKWKCGEKQLVLTEQDTLLFYSDGLIEAVDESGTAIGYPRLKEVLPTLRGRNPEETEQAIWNWFRRLSPRDPPEDDVSMIVLQHSPRQAGEDT